MKYEFGGRIRFSETDESGRLSVDGLVNYFQDVSTFQSEHLGIGIEYLKQRDAAWILSSWQIVIDRMPKLCEEVTAQTWAYEFRQFYGLRNFTLLDGAGNMAAWANSVWVLFDMRRGRPLKVFPELTERYELSERLDMEYAPRKITVPEGGKAQEPFQIGKHHLDTNHHVNNGQYIAMAQEYLPAGFSLGQLRAEYRMQARLQDRIHPAVLREDHRITVSLNNEEGKPYAVVELSERQ